MGKRLFDVSASAALLVLLAPVLLATALVVWVTLGRPVFFIQLRPGLRGELFKMVKFRTMSDARDLSGELLPDVSRLGCVGRALRASSLDELPELWNVLVGDMSLVGPRPLLPEYLPLYTAEQSRRHDVKPGITGFAQVNGRNAITWEQRFRYDVWYVDNRSLWLDLRILWATLVRVVRSEGINETRGATQSPFRGSEHAPHD